MKVPCAQFKLVNNPLTMNLLLILMFMHGQIKGSRMYVNEVSAPWAACWTACSCQ